MILRNSTYDEFADYIKSNNYQIIAYGAGVIGKVALPDFLEEYGLSKYIRYYIDTDKNKHNSKIKVGNNLINIFDISYLNNVYDKVIILITNSNYNPIIQYLDSIPTLDNIEAYIFPFMQVKNIHFQSEDVKTKCSTRYIPKVIHYCWFSKNPIPPYLRKCIESWKKFCPDYEIIEWNEDNYDYNAHEYTRQAYINKKWAFVSDFARFEILYEHGGIYVDTDVEFIKNIDNLLFQQAFIGAEKWGIANSGGCCGCVPKNDVIKKILDFRKSFSMKNTDGTLNMETCGYYETMPLIEMGFRPNNKTQFIGNITVYSSDYFHPYDYMTGETNITDNTYSIHHFNGGWLNDEAKLQRNRSRELYYETLKRMEKS